MQTLFTTLLIILATFSYSLGQQDYDIKADSLSWGVLGDYGIRMPYYKIPFDQIQPIQFCGNVTNFGDSTLYDLQLNVSENYYGWSGIANSDSLHAGNNDSLCVVDYLFPFTEGFIQFSSQVSTSSPESNTLNNHFDTLLIEYTADFWTEYARDNIFKGIQNGISDTSYFFEAGNIFELFQPEAVPYLSVVVHPSSVEGESIYGQIYSYDEQTGDFTLYAATNYYNLTQWDIQGGEPIQLGTLGLPYLPVGTYLVTIASDMTGPNKVVIGTSGSSPDSTSFKRTYNNWNFQSIYETPMVRLVVNPEGLEENVKRINMDVFPNPATFKAIVSFELNSEFSVKVFITDVTGKVVYTNDLGKVNGSNKLEINTGTLANGIYTINIETNGYISTQKLVVRK